MDTRKTCRVALAILLLTCGTVLLPAATAEDATESAAPQVLYLHTEFFPYQNMGKGDRYYRLAREIVRQAFVVAAREEMGAIVFDETLDETLPAGSEALHLIVSERGNWNGKWKVQLYAYTEGVDWRESEPVWEKTYKYKTNPATMYGDMVPKLEADSRGDFVEALTKAGLTPRKRAAGAAEEPADSKTAGEIDQLLQEVDFIVQFGAVRKAHEEIAQHGETPERLGRLARGYAHLSLLTPHLWCSASEAFAARAWMYGHRMAAASEGTADALRNRAYAWALTGVMRFALEDIERLAALEGDGAAEVATEGATQGLPEWWKLVEPFARCKRDALKELATQVESLRPWARLLDYEVAHAYRYPQWTFEAAREVAQAAPGALSIYSDMALRGGTLQALRAGGYYAPYYFGQQVPQSLEKVPDLPQPILAVLPTDVVRRGLLGVVVNDPDPDDNFSALPSYVARELRKVSATQSSSGLSWSVLAYLLEEEQFVEAAHFFESAKIGTESSKGTDVDGVLPLVRGHRYAAYIDSFRYQRRIQAAEFRKAFKQMAIRDMRGNMISMTENLFGFPSDTHKDIGLEAWHNMSRDFTMRGMTEFVYLRTNGWRFDEAMRKPAAGYARELSGIAPKLEVGTRMRVQTAKSPKPEELHKWEKKIKIDPDAYALLAGHYQRMGRREDAIRCYESALSILPTVKNTVGLANLYAEANQRDQWERVLLDFVAQERVDVMDKSTVHQQLAYGYMREGEWERGVPHAETSAKTYATLGLQAASRACEGAGQWEASERWIRAMSESYTSYGGYEWYFWCCRTGRGDEEASLKKAEQFFSRLSSNLSASNCKLLGAFRLLQGDVEGARDAYEKSYALQKSLYTTCMLVQLSRALEEEQAAEKAIARFEAFIAQEEERKTWSAETLEAGLAILELIKSHDMSPERLAELETKIAAIKVESTRSSYCYLVGTELSILGEEELAEVYWRRALTTPQFDLFDATLAGRELSMRYGTSRPEENVLGKSDLWPGRKEAN